MACRQSFGCSGGMTSSKGSFFRHFLMLICLFNERERSSVIKCRRSHLTSKAATDIFHFGFNDRRDCRVVAWISFIKVMLGAKKALAKFLASSSTLSNSYSRLKINGKVHGLSSCEGGKNYYFYLQKCKAFR